MAAWVGSGVERHLKVGVEGGAVAEEVGPHEDHQEDHIAHHPDYGDNVVDPAVEDLVDDVVEPVLVLGHGGGHWRPLSHSWPGQHALLTGQSIRDHLG